jgi:predicted acylesterase/phospholipase RssA
MRALVQSGGAVKGAYQVGVLKKWMFDDGLDYDIFCGVSVGSINSAYLAQFPGGEPAASWTKLRGLWDRVRNENIWKNWCLGKVSALWKPSILNTEPLLEWIQNELDVKAIKSSGKKLRVGVVSWKTGEYKIVTELDDDLAKWVSASSSFPVFMLPIEIGGQLWGDGGLRSVTPLGEAIRSGADEIDVIMCSNPDRPSDWHGKAAVPDYVLQTLNIMGDEIVLADLQVCGLKNDLAELNPKYRKVKIRVVMPSEGLTDDSLDFDPESIKRMIEIGYKDACKVNA